MGVHGCARDLRTSPTGEPEEVAHCELHARVAPDRTLASIDGPDPRLQQLTGALTARGFRAAAATALPGLESSPSPLRLLLDDLPPALLVSGFAFLAADALPDAPPDRRGFAAQIDVCAGWASGTGIAQFAREHGRIPTPVAVRARSFDDPDDTHAWHDAPLPAPPATRRRRLLDVRSPVGSHDVEVHALFRDSHIGPDGIERSFHEYAVTATIDARTRRVAVVDAAAGVLPWRACPSALASAGRIVGTSIDDVRPEVRATFRGTATCTHLNDVLASIGDTAVLLELLTM